MASPKRARTGLQIALPEPPGREQLLICQPLRERLGKKYCDESELMPLLITNNFVRRVRTFEVLVLPLGGDSFQVRLNASWPTVGEAKSEITRVLGTKEAQQELYKVAVRADGGSVREDDAEPELLADKEMHLCDGDMVTMAVKEGGPLIWQTCPLDRVTVSEGGAVATQVTGDYSLVTTDAVLTEGRHYWEVKIMSRSLFVIQYVFLCVFNYVCCPSVKYFFHRHIYVGVCRPNLNPDGDYCRADCTDGWFINAYAGELFGNGKSEADGAGRFDRGDRVGVLLDLDEGSLYFFRNRVKHGTLACLGLQSIRAYTLCIAVYCLYPCVCESLPPAMLMILFCIYRPWLLLW
jgi:hypothetical protein